jgi:hypothetical protein
MRILILAIALALATSVAAQEAKPTPRIDFGGQSPASTPKRKLSVSPEEQKKIDAAMDGKRKAAEEAKQKAWDARLKRTMSGICRGC